MLLLKKVMCSKLAIKRTSQQSLKLTALFFSSLFLWYSFPAHVSALTTFIKKFDFSHSYHKILFHVSYLNKRRMHFQEKVFRN